MKLKLKSDFRDYYDHWFARNDVPTKTVFDRMSRNSMTRLEQFKLLTQAGLDTPIYGRIGDSQYMNWQQRLLPLSLPDAKVVVYVDDLAHRGEGKRLVAWDEALSKHKNQPFSVFIPTTEQPEEEAISSRYLQVGDRAWWLQYTGKGSWLSNHAPEVEIKVVSESFYFWQEGERFSVFRQYPLFAIDFVSWKGIHGKLAVDFNSAPGISGTGLEDILSAKDCYEAIAFWIAYYLSG